MRRPYHEKLEITYRNPDKIPKYIQKDIIIYKLEIEVMKIRMEVTYDNTNIRFYRRYRET